MAIRNYVKNPQGTLFLPLYGIDDTPADGEVPIWDNTAKKLAFGTGGGGATDLEGLSDVDLTTPTTDDGLYYNGTLWVNGPDMPFNARVGVRKNSAGSTFKRRRVNLIEGNNVTLTVADDSGNEEVDVTITAIAGGGGGGDSFSYFDIDKPPGSAGTYDDEFETDLSAWTQVNWSSLSADVDSTVPGALWVSVDASAGNTHRAIVRTLSSGDFCVVAPFRLSSAHANFLYASIILSDSNTAGTGNQCMHAFVSDSSLWRIYTQTTTGFAGAIGTPIGPINWYGNTGYLGIRRVSTTYTFGWSPDGRTWAELTGAPGFTPSYIGFMFMGNGAQKLNVSIPWFRSSSTGSTFAQFGGTRTVIGS